MKHRSKMTTSGGRIGGLRNVMPSPRRLESGYSLSQVARLLSVDKRTVRKWLGAEDRSDPGIIPFEKGWFRLPNGQIRIRERAVQQLLAGEI